jgi:hypothetical protein
MAVEGGGGGFSGAGATGQYDQADHALDIRQTLRDAANQAEKNKYASMKLMLDLAAKQAEQRQQQEQTAHDLIQAHVDRQRQQTEQAVQAMKEQAKAQGEGQKGPGPILDAPQIGATGADSMQHAPTVDQSVNLDQPAQPGAPPPMPPGGPQPGNPVQGAPAPGQPPTPGAVNAGPDAMNSLLGQGGPGVGGQLGGFDIPPYLISATNRQATSPTQVAPGQFMPMTTSEQTTRAAPNVLTAGDVLKYRAMANMNLFKQYMGVARFNEMAGYHDELVKNAKERVRASWARVAIEDRKADATIRAENTRNQAEQLRVLHGLYDPQALQLATLPENSDAYNKVLGTVPDNMQATVKNWSKGKLAGVALTGITDANKVAVEADTKDYITAKQNLGGLRDSIANLQAVNPQSQAGIGNWAQAQYLWGKIQTGMANPQDRADYQRWVEAASTLAASRAAQIRATFPGRFIQAEMSLLHDTLFDIKQSPEQIDAIVGNMNRAASYLAMRVNEYGSRIGSDPTLIAKLNPSDISRNEIDEKLLHAYKDARDAGMQPQDAVKNVEEMYKLIPNSLGSMLGKMPEATIRKILGR